MTETLQYVHDETESTKLYKERWFTLILFILYSASSLMQYFHYTVIADVVAQYYCVPYITIYWSVLVQLITFSALSFPGNYIMDRIGLRNAVLVGTVGTCIGTAIKFASVHPDRFWVAILAQEILSVFHVCMIPLLPRVTAVWFGIKEIATANALGLVGIQLAIGLSFLVPPMIVFKGEADDIARRLDILNIILTGFSVCIAIFVYFFFSNAPPTPPSVAQKVLNETKKNKHPSGFIYICTELFGNKSYIIFIIVYTINTKTISTFQTILNDLFLHHYPDATHHAGIIELLMYFFGIAGLLSVGVILDKYKNFKVTIYTSYIIYFLSVALFIGLLDQGIPFVYATAIIMGIANGSLFTSAIELVMELTYPLPENITFGLAIIASNIGNMIIVLLYTIIFEIVGIFWANIAILIIIFVTDFLFYFIKFDLKRQSAQNPTVRETNVK